MIVCVYLVGNSHTDTHSHITRTTARPPAACVRISSPPAMAAYTQQAVADERDCPLRPVLRLTSNWGEGAVVEVRVGAWSDDQRFVITFPGQPFLKLDERSLAHVVLEDAKLSTSVGADTVLRLRLVPLEYLHLCYDTRECPYVNTKMAFSFTLNPPPVLATPGFEPRMICHDGSWPPMSPPPPHRVPPAPPTPMAPPWQPPPPSPPPSPPPPPPRPSPPPPAYLWPDPPPPPPPLHDAPSPPPVEDGNAELAIAMFVLLFLLFASAVRHLWQLRGQRLRGEAELAAARAAPEEGEDDLNVILDLGEEGEHELQIPKRGITSGKQLRATIAKVAKQRVGQRYSLSVTLTFAEGDHHEEGKEGTQTRLTDRTSVARILAATGAIAEPN